MKKTRNQTIFGLIIFAALLLLIMTPRTVHAKETDVTEEMLSEIQSRVEKAFQAGEAQADLSDLDIIVNMYSDKLGKQYQKLLDLCQDFAKDHGLFVLGRHRESYISPAPLVEATEDCNEYGVGPNRLTAIELGYDAYYRLEDDSADLELIARTQEKLTREYELAMSAVSEEMSDVEKALALYDAIIAMSNYPDAEGTDENGTEFYDSESYSAISVFRDHISVCVANATAYCYLLSDCGIPCIRVDSSEMSHSWAMLKVEGAWYHADPTWDNVRYMDGWTSQGDVNNDIWDLGAAGHTYFLKSDEEMENGLEHYGWELTADYTKDASMEGAPASGPSGSFDSLFFGSGSPWPVDVHYNYVNGDWYFLNWITNQIVKTTLGQDPEEASSIDAPNDHRMKYVFGSGECLFICEEEGIWRYNTRSGAMEQLPLAENDADRGQPQFTEMNVASGRLNGVVIYTNEAGEAEPVEFSYPVEELLEMKVSPETEEPVTTEAETTEPETTEDAGTTEAGTTEARTEGTESAAAGTELPETSETGTDSTAAGTETEAEVPDGRSQSAAAYVLAGLAAAALLSGIILAVKKKGGRR